MSAARQTSAWGLGDLFDYGICTGIYNEINTLRCWFIHRKWIKFICILYYILLWLLGSQRTYLYFCNVWIFPFLDSNGWIKRFSQKFSYSTPLNITSRAKFSSALVYDKLYIATTSGVAVKLKWWTLYRKLVKVSMLPLAQPPQNSELRVHHVNFWKSCQQWCSGTNLKQKGSSSEKFTYIHHGHECHGNLELPCSTQSETEINIFFACNVDRI